MYFLVFHVVKFLKPSEEVYPFQGDGEVQYHVYHAEQKDQRRLRKTLPKHLQTQTIVTRGKIFLLFVKIDCTVQTVKTRFWHIVIQPSLNKILGNESLVSSCGYFPGSHVLLNSGLATHGGSGNQGLSKAMAMVFHLIISPVQYEVDVPFNEAWTPLDILKIRSSHLPFLNTMAQALDHYYTVSFDILDW